MLRKLTSPPVARTAAGRLLRQGCCVVRASRARSSAASGTILKGQCHTAPPTESTWLGVGSGSGLGLGVGLGLESGLELGLRLGLGLGLGSGSRSHGQG